MSKVLANPKIFGAACLLFAGATLFNATVNASTPRQGLGLQSAPSSLSVSVVELGPTIPPSPWDDPSTLSIASSKL